MRERPKAEVTVMKGGDPTELTVQEIDNSRGNQGHRGDARHSPEAKAGGAQAKFYRVTRGGRVLDSSGQRIELKAMKEIDNLNYDIAKLKIQGIKLEEIKAEDRTIGGFAVDMS